MNIRYSKMMFIFLLFNVSMHATDNNRYSELKVRTSAFIPTSHKFREIYGKVAANVALEFATDVYSCMQAWVNADWLISKKGHSLGFCNATSISSANISFGLKAPYEICNWLSFYAGVGPNFACVRIKDCSLFSGPSCCTKWGVGGVLKTGLYFSACNRFFVDIFADYLYQQVKFQQKANVSGLKLGVGVGVTF